MDIDETVKSSTDQNVDILSDKEKISFNPYLQEKQINDEKSPNLIVQENNSTVTSENEDELLSFSKTNTTSETRKQNSDMNEENETIRSDESTVTTQVTEAVATTSSDDQNEVENKICENNLESVTKEDKNTVSINIGNNINVTQTILTNNRNKFPTDENKVKESEEKIEKEKTAEVCEEDVRYGTKNSCEEPAEVFLGEKSVENVKNIILERVEKDKKSLNAEEKTEIDKVDEKENVIVEQKCSSNLSSDINKTNSLLNNIEEKFERLYKIKEGEIDCDEEREVSEDKMGEDTDDVHRMKRKDGDEKLELRKEETNIKTKLDNDEGKVYNNELDDKRENGVNNSYKIEEQMVDNEEKGLCKNEIDVKKEIIEVDVHKIKEIDGSEEREISDVTDDKEEKRNNEREADDEKGENEIGDKEDDVLEMEERTELYNNETDGKEVDYLLRTNLKGREVNEEKDDKRENKDGKHYSKEETENVKNNIKIIDQISEKSKDVQIVVNGDENDCNISLSEVNNTEYELNHEKQDNKTNHNMNNDVKMGEDLEEQKEIKFVEKDNQKVGLKKEEKRLHKDKESDLVVEKCNEYNDDVSKNEHLENKMKYIQSHVNIESDALVENTTKDEVESPDKVNGENYNDQNENINEKSTFQTENQLLRSSGRGTRRNSKFFDSTPSKKIHSRRKSTKLTEINKTNAESESPSSTKYNKYELSRKRESKEFEKDSKNVSKKNRLNDETIPLAAIKEKSNLKEKNENITVQDTIQTRNKSKISQEDIRKQTSPKIIGKQDKRKNEEDKVKRKSINEVQEIEHFMKQSSNKSQNKITPNSEIKQTPGKIKRNSQKEDKKISPLMSDTKVKKKIIEDIIPSENKSQGKKNTEKEDEKMDCEDIDSKEIIKEKGHHVTIKEEITDSPHIDQIKHTTDCKMEIDEKNDIKFKKEKNDGIHKDSEMISKEKQNRFNQTKTNNIEKNQDKNALKNKMQLKECKIEETDNFSVKQEEVVVEKSIINTPHVIKKEISPHNQKVREAWRREPLLKENFRLQQKSQNSFLFNTTNHEEYESDFIGFSTHYYDSTIYMYSNYIQYVQEEYGLAHPWLQYKTQYYKSLEREIQPKPMKLSPTSYVKLPNHFGIKKSQEQSLNSTAPLKMSNQSENIQTCHSLKELGTPKSLNNSDGSIIALTPNDGSQIEPSDSESTPLAQRILPTKSTPNKPKSLLTRKRTIIQSIIKASPMSPSTSSLLRTVKLKTPTKNTKLVKTDPSRKVKSRKNNPNKKDNSVPIPVNSSEDGKESIGKQDLEKSVKKSTKKSLTEDESTIETVCNNDSETPGVEDKNNQKRKKSFTAKELTTDEITRSENFASDPSPAVEAIVPNIPLLKESNETYKLPLIKYNWRREIVYKHNSDTGNANIHILYYSPTGRQFQSVKEIFLFLSPRTELKPHHFNFEKEKLGLESTYESMREITQKITPTKIKSSSPQTEKTNKNEPSRTPKSQQKTRKIFFNKTSTPPVVGNKSNFLSIEKPSIVEFNNGTGIKRKVNRFKESGSKELTARDKRKRYMGRKPPHGGDIDNSIVDSKEVESRAKRNSCKKRKFSLVDDGSDEDYEEEDEEISDDEMIGPKGKTNHFNGRITNNILENGNLTKKIKLMNTNEKEMKLTDQSNNKKDKLQNNENVIGDSLEKNVKNNVNIESTSFKRLVPSKHNLNAIDHLSNQHNALIHLCTFLRVEDLLSFARVNRLFNSVAHVHTLWKIVKLKNSKIYDWLKFSDCLIRHNTHTLDMLKMITSTNPEENDKIWKQFYSVVGKLTSLKRLDLGRVTEMEILNTLNNCSKNLEEFNVIALKATTIDLKLCLKLINLQVLQLRSFETKKDNGLILMNLPSLSNLSNLRHLSLTGVKNLKSFQTNVFEKFPPLESLELGDCIKLDETFPQNSLSHLIDLKRLRLENVHGIIANKFIETIGNLPNLNTLELINIDTKVGFDETCKKLNKIENLLIFPTYITQSSTTNWLLLSGLCHLKSNLKHLTWGLTQELLKVTNLFLEQWNSQRHLNKGLSMNSEQLKLTLIKSNSIPVMKPLPNLFNGQQQDGGEQIKESEENKSMSELDIICIDKLKLMLENVLCNTQIKLIIVPVNSTTRIYLPNGN